MKILIVDDSKTSRILFKAYMPKEEQYQVIEAANFAEALAKAREVQPELVVLDYNIPGQNGMEIAQAMLQAGLKAKLVLMTANTQKAIVDAARDLGFVWILEKPVNAEKIADMLAQVA